MQDNKPRKQDQKGLFFLLLSAFAGLLCLSGTALAVFETERSTWVPVLIGVLILLGVESALAFLFTKKSKNSIEAEDSTVQKLTTEVLKNLASPVVISETNGKISWSNSTMQTIFVDNDYHGSDLEAVTGVTMAELTRAEAPEGCRVEMFGKQYKALSYIMPVANKDFWMTFFEDVTKLVETEAQLAEESPVIVYAVVDNIDKISQFVRSSSREETGRIEKQLTEWAKNLGGFIREYDRDKYMIAFPKNRLSELAAGGFEILSEIRNAADPSAAMPVTVSMGISECGCNVSEREADAAAALETALQRGGDQVVLRDNTGRFAYFGGKTKTDITPTRIGTRTAAIKLIQLVKESGNVLIMGHASPDFDSIGGCIGLYRLASAFNPEVRIVVDRQNPNFRVSTANLRRVQPEYERVFISGDDGLEMLRSDTLLIVADVNNMKIVECPELAANAARQVIIDHHRKVADFDIAPIISVIEPGTSSCTELVSEMLEFSASSHIEVGDALTPTPDEANVMLSGIMLDTKNFTRTTGEETFAAALYLRSNGADTEKVRTFFFNEEEGVVAEARLISNLKRFRDRIAITAEKSAGENGKISPEERIIASKVAESLLEVKDTDASFVMFYTNTDVLISARSNGKINVQLILENLGGGGRYDAAGAQVYGKSFQVVSEMLKEAIDKFLASETSQTEE